MCLYKYMTIRSMLQCSFYFTRMCGQIPLVSYYPIMLSQASILHCLYIVNISWAVTTISSSFSDINSEDGMCRTVDTHRCGRCGITFTSLEDYIQHQMQEHKYRVCYVKSTEDRRVVYPRLVRKGGRPKATTKEITDSVGIASNIGERKGL